MLNWEEVQGIIRAILTTGAGAMAAHGYIGSSDVEMIVGAVLTLTGVIWSIASKRTGGVK